MDHPLLNLAELREEAGTTVGTLLSLVSSPSISRQVMALRKCSVSKMWKCVHIHVHA